MYSHQITFKYQSEEEVVEEIFWMIVNGNWQQLLAGSGTLKGPSWKPNTALRGWGGPITYMFSKYEVHRTPENVYSILYK